MLSARRYKFASGRNETTENPVTIFWNIYFDTIKTSIHQFIDIASLFKGHFFFLFRALLGRSGTILTLGLALHHGLATVKVSVSKPSSSFPILDFEKLLCIHFI